MAIGATAGQGVLECALCTSVQCSVCIIMVLVGSVKLAVCSAMCDRVVVGATGGQSQALICTPGPRPGWAITIMMMLLMMMTMAIR